MGKQTGIFISEAGGFTLYCVYFFSGSAKQTWKTPTVLDKSK